MKMLFLEPLLIQGQIGDVILPFANFDPIQHVLREPVQIGTFAAVAVLDQQFPLSKPDKIDRQRQQVFRVIDLAVDSHDLCVIKLPPDKSRKAMLAAEKWAQGKPIESTLLAKELTLSSESRCQKAAYFYDSGPYAKSLTHSSLDEWYGYYKTPERCLRF